MSENSFFVQRIKTNPAAQETLIDDDEVEKKEAWFHNALGDYRSCGLKSTQCYSRDFINKVIELAKEKKHVVPEAMFNIIGRNDKRQRLWATRDLGEIAYLYNYYDFVSKADALECKRQLQELNKQMSQKENHDKQLMDNIKRAIADVENQLKKFADLSR